MGLSLLAGPGGLRTRLRGAFLFAITAVLVFSLWLPLILLHADIFRAQFGGNVLHRAGPGLGKTLMAPWSVLGYQFGQVWGYVQPIQAVLYGLALAWGQYR